MNKLYVSFLIVLSFATIPLGAKADRAGGGGDAQKSTRADLEEVIKNIDRHLWEISDRYLYGGPFQITAKSLKPELTWVTKEVLGTSSFAVSNSFYDYAKQLKFNIVDAPCFEGKEEKDASTPFVKNAPVCLSATRLSRFPKSTLKLAIMPIIFHEVAHQFGFKEDDANRLQTLSDIHLNYRPIYLSAYRAKMGCEHADLNPTIPTMLMYCAAQSNSTGENLRRIYDGDIWANFDPKSLSPKEKDMLLAYNHDQRQFSFLEVIHALTEPPMSGYNNTSNPLLIMKLGATAALDLIDQEVGRLQDNIK